MKKKLAVCLLCAAVFFVSCGKKDLPAMRREKAQDTLVLKNGSMIQGVITKESDADVTIRIPEGEIGFPRGDIAEVRRGETLVASKDGIQPVYAPSDAEAPYPRIYLKDGRLASGNKISKDGNTFYLWQALEGGGNISFGFEVDKIERVELWPLSPDEKLDRDFKALRDLNMKYAYKKPPYYIVSTVESSDLVVYFRVLQQFFSDFAMRFLEFIDPDQPPPPLGIVIFADHNDFLRYAGLPRNTSMAGFYMPDKKFLVLFNVKETDMVRFRLARASFVENRIGDVKTKIELYSGPRSEGKWAAYDYLEKIQFSAESDRMRVEGWARELTMQVIRHEAGHQLFDLLGVDSAASYRGAWLSEGLAEYVSTNPLGGVNKDRLMFIRSELDGGSQLMPLQYLMSIQNGAGIRKFQNPQYTLLAYAQSWALVHCLMERHEAPFKNYLRELKTAGKDFDAAKDTALLEKHLGKSLAELDLEAEKYIREIMVSHLDKDEYDFYRLIQKKT